MLPSALLWAGLTLCLVAAIGLVRPIASLRLSTRRRAGAVVAVGALVCGAAIALPPRDQRIGVPRTRLDEIIPVWQFAERHETRVEATTAEVERAVREVTAREIRLFLLLTWLRNPRRTLRPDNESILAPAPDRPILEVALDSGFHLLAEEPGREIVFGTFVIAPAGADPNTVQWSAEQLHDLTTSGYAKAVMNFTLTAEGGRATRLTTETRVHATDPATARRFAAYWRLIYPGSSLIRRMWLAAIKRRAEGPG